MKIKRYDMRRSGSMCDMCDIEEEEREDGEWVRYEDVKHLIEEDECDGDACKVRIGR